MNKRVRWIIAMLALCSCFISLVPVGKSNAQTTVSKEEIDNFIQNNMNKYNIPGLSLAITYQDQIIYTKGYGHTSDNNRVTEDTPFAIASLSKAFTGLAVMQLVEEGKIKLDSPLTAYIPTFRLADPRGAKITVRHLLQHTSGLNDLVNPDMTRDSQYRALRDVVPSLKSVMLANDPGKKYNYHNPNYLLLAYLIEVVSKEKFSDYLRTHIFQPLEMKQTSEVAVTSQLKGIANVPKGHYHLFGRPVPLIEPGWFIEGPAGVVSTANDMAKWLLLQGNHGKYEHKQIVSAKGLQQTHTSNDPNVDYGMGWVIGETETGKKQIQHGGILWTYKAEAVLLPDSGYGIVVLFNSGLNAFIDYTIFTRGIANLLTDQPSVPTAVNNQWVEIGIIALIILTIGFGIRKLRQMKQWDQKRMLRPKWLTILYSALYLVPLGLLATLPQLLAFIGGQRVITWQGIFLMMPSISILLLVISCMNLLILGVRVYRIIRR